MNEATLKLIEDLATKLGTTTEHLWGAMLRQAPVSATCEIVSYALLIVGIVMAWKLVSKKTTAINESQYAEWSGDGAFMAWAILFFVIIVVVGLFVFSLPGIVSGFVNPDFWAMQQVMHLLAPWQ